MSRTSVMVRHSAQRIDAQVLRRHHIGKTDKPAPVISGDGNLNVQVLRIIRAPLHIQSARSGFTARMRASAGQSLR